MTIRRCTAVLVLAVGLATVELSAGQGTVGPLLVVGSLAFLAVSTDSFGAIFVAMNDSDDGEPGT